MKEQRYQGDYMHKSDHHIYIEPPHKIRDTVAHYTITAPANKPLRCTNYHILPDASGCIILQEEIALYWGPMQELVIQENDLERSSPRFFIEFRPGGLYQISGKPMAPYMNKREALSAFDHTIDHELRTLYKNSQTYEELIQSCNTWMEERIQLHSLPARMIHAMNLIEQAKGNISVDHVASSCHISMRQLRRDFSIYIGLSPKQYANVTRINCIIKELSEDEWITNALAGGFFDQSHFNKMFKQVLGVSPTQYIHNVDDFYRELYKF